jgi:hypothetical protein
LRSRLLLGQVARQQPYRAMTTIASSPSLEWGMSIQRRTQSFSLRSTERAFQFYKCFAPRLVLKGVEAGTLQAQLGEKKVIIPACTQAVYMQSQVACGVHPVLGKKDACQLALFRCPAQCVANIRTYARVRNGKTILIIEQMASDTGQSIASMFGCSTHLSFPGHPCF